MGFLTGEVQFDFELNQFKCGSMIQILVETTMSSFHFTHPKCGYVLQTPSQTCTKSNGEID